MHSKHKSRLVIGSILVGGVLIIAAWQCSPGISPGAGYNPPARIYNFFAYAYYFTRAQWLGKSGENRYTRHAAALAAWYRPSQTRLLLRIDPADYFTMGREYASLGLGKEAGYFFKLSFQKADWDEDRALDIISYMAILGDWRSVSSFSERLLSVSPESAETNYWLGRSLVESGKFSQAIPFLDRAYELDKSATDSLYQKARAYEQSGLYNQARNHYQEVIRLSPGQQTARQALRNLSPTPGDIHGELRSGSELDRYSPSTPENPNFENMFLLLDYSINEKELFTGDTVQIDICFQGWRLQNRVIQPEVVLIDQTGAKARIELEAVKISNPGEVTKASLPCGIPTYLAPGPIDIILSFRDLDTNLQVGMNNTARNDLLLAQFNLKPKWITSHTKVDLVQRHFGINAQSLRKRTFLAYGSSLHLDLNGEDKIEALGLVSNISCPSPNRVNLWQGRIIGHILVATDNGEEISFPISIGIHTSDFAWELSRLAVPLHNKAEIYQSSIARWREPYFTAHQYYTIYEFPIPVRLKSLQVECVVPGLVIQISDLVLLTCGAVLEQ